MDVPCLHFHEDLKAIRKVKERVVFLYNRFPKSVESDRVLIDSYLRAFFGVGRDTFYDELIDVVFDNGISFEAITRAGRHLREKYPERYARSEAVRDRCVEKEFAYRTFYGGR